MESWTLIPVRTNMIPVLVRFSMSGPNNMQIICKIICNLKEKRFTLAGGFRVFSPWSAGPSIMVGEHTRKYSRGEQTKEERAGEKVHPAEGWSW